MFAGTYGSDGYITSSDGVHWELRAFTRLTASEGQNVYITSLAGGNGRFVMGVWDYSTSSDRTIALAEAPGVISKASLPDDLYTLPTATNTVNGGIELYSNTPHSVAANAVRATSGRTYGLQLNSSGQGVVNVPWANTTYSAATTSAAGLMSAEDKSKLDRVARGT